MHLLNHFYPPIKRGSTNNKFTTSKMHKDRLQSPKHYLDYSTTTHHTAKWPCVYGSTVSVSNTPVKYNGRIIFNQPDHLTYQQDEFYNYMCLLRINYYNRCHCNAVKIFLASQFASLTMKRLFLRLTNNCHDPQLHFIFQCFNSWILFSKLDVY